VAQFLRTSDADGSVVVRVDGEVDIAVVENLQAVVRPCLAEGSAVELDLSGLEFIDSSGLGALVQLRVEADRKGAKLRLRDLPPSTSRLFDITGLATVFDIRTSAQAPDDAGV
jgi:anti-anti-sigma factor